MPRPTTKTDLLQTADAQYKKMWESIHAMSEDERYAAFCFGTDIKQKEAHWKRDKNLRDVLIHLYEWHQLLLQWVFANQNEDPKPFLPAPYNWKTYGDMNVMFWEKHQNTAYADAEAMLLDSHQKVISMIESFSDEELFARKHFSWTGTSTLGSYCTSATAAHYEWALKKLKAHRKTYAQGHSA